MSILVKIFQYAPLIAVFIEEEMPVFSWQHRAAASQPAKFLSHLFMDVLHGVDKARWMTAALFGPAGSETNNPIMLPGEMRRAACQEHSAV